MQDLLKMLDLSKEDISAILDLADQLKYDQRHNIPHRYLEGKTLAMIFAKNSTRTWVSFESGHVPDGRPGHLNARESQIEQGGSRWRTPPRTLSRYCDCVMIRTYAQEEAEVLAKRRHPGDQRPHRLRPPLPGAGGPDDHSGENRLSGGREAVLHRGRQQYG